MTVVESGTKFWELVSDVPFEQEKLSPETRDLMRRMLFVAPLPPVKRVIFIATPHRGSFWAGNFVGKIARRLIDLPGTVTRATVELMTLRPLQAAQTAFRNRRRQSTTWTRIMISAYAGVAADRARGAGELGHPGPG